MACSACVDTIIQAIHQLDATAVIETDLKTKAVLVTTQSPEQVIRDAIANAGYPIA